MVRWIPIFCRTLNIDTVYQKFTTTFFYSSVLPCISEEVTFSVQTPFISSLVMVHGSVVKIVIKAEH